MDFVDRIRELAARAPQQLQHISTEEATKNALVLPFLGALGYDVFNPTEVTPELTADVGVKKGEKVDYAVLLEGKPIMLFEVKGCSCSLDHAHMSQLYRYFSVTAARIGVLTNGIQYRFFTDLDAPNKMDDRPFLEVDLLSLDEHQLAQLRKFAKSQFQLDSILDSATDLKYTGEMKKILAREVETPSEELVRFFTSRVYSGRLTQTVREQFTEITRKALQEFIRDRVRDRLESALAGEARARPPVEEQASAAGETAPAGTQDDVETTDEEWEAFYIVRAILSADVDPKRVVMRDVKSYCGILLDDNNRKPICRLHFNTGQKYVGLFDEEKNESRVPLGEVTELYAMADQLRVTVERYEPPS